MGWFVVLLGLAGIAYLGYFAFTMLTGMEKDIRRELDEVPAAEKKESPATAKPTEQVAAAVKKKAAPETPRATPPEKPSAAAELSLEEQILKHVKGHRGVLQTELYDKFPEQERRVLQKALAAMDADGTLRREKEKSTYRLFPAKAKKA